MIDQSKVDRINKVVEEYFEKNPEVSIVPVKKLMPDFIKVEIFIKDTKNGLPIRKFLRSLDDNKQLDLIPNIYTEREGQTIYWYFVPSNAEAREKPYMFQEKKPETIARIATMLEKDVNYVIDLCDEIIGAKANRQKRFWFLVGELHKDEKTRTRLPISAFYERLNLVVDFKEEYIHKLDAEVKHVDKDEESNYVAGGLSRSELRKIYEQRKSDLIPKHKINFVAISNSDFTCDKQNKIIRNKLKIALITKFKPLN
jgi:hypothetical protein